MNKLQYERKKAKLSQNQLATKAKVNVQTIQALEIETNDINNSRLITLLKLATALNVRLENIVTNEELISLLKDYNHLIIN